MERKEYWENNYFQYWQDKTQKANLNIPPKEDINTANDELLLKILAELDICANSKVLDFGCGFCRIYPYINDIGAEYYGIDIAQQMVDEGAKKYPVLDNHLFVCEGELLPFQAHTFDLIVCFGVFDACFQSKALTEMFRVLNNGGRIVISGKNSKYYHDDKLAYEAEVNARKKGHPNFFTDIRSLKKQIQERSIDIESERYFLYRGDFSGFNYVKAKVPPKFYEWLFVLKKNNAINEFMEFSSNFSQTYNEKNEGYIVG